MTKLNLNDLTKRELVAIYAKLVGAPGDYARRSREYYQKALEATGAAELVEAAATIPAAKPRKVRADVLEKRRTLANAREFHAIVRALHSWGDDLLSNPDAHKTLLERATKALSAAAR